MIAYQRNAEIDYLKLIVIVNAIIQTGNRIAAAVTGGESSGQDALRKSLDALEKIMLPHRSEERDHRAAQVKKILEREMKGGPLKVKRVGGNDRGKRRSGVKRK